MTDLVCPYNNKCRDYRLGSPECCFVDYYMTCTEYRRHEVSDLRNARHREALALNENMPVREPREKVWIRRRQARR